MSSIIKETPLSNERVNHTKLEFNKAFNQYSLGRKIISVKELSKDEIKSNTIQNKKFFTFGINHLIEKVWFIDVIIEGKCYAYETIGKDYGKSLGIGETKYIIETIIKECKNNNNIEKYSRLTVELLKSILNKMRTNNTKVDVILTNIIDKNDFLNMNSFNVDRPQFDKIGTIFDIPVYMSPDVPVGLTLLLNKNLGTLYIKSPFNFEIKDEFDKDKVLKDLKSLTDNELDERVILVALETIKFEIENKDSIFILEKTTL